jgi:hypothetical protein
MNELELEKFRTDFPIDKIFKRVFEYFKINIPKLCDSPLLV